MTADIHATAQSDRATTATMRAVAFTRSLPVDDPASQVDVELPRPVPGARDLLVEVRAVSVNPVDVKVRGGGDPDGARVLGFDAAGVANKVDPSAQKLSHSDN